MKSNREAFYAGVLKSFGADALDARPGRSMAARAGFDAILDAWEQLFPAERDEWLAYVLATAWHETGTTMAPVRETFARTDEQAVGKLAGKAYAQRKPNGNAYYGRGYVQLTWDFNYRNLSRRLGRGDDLYNQPDLVMEPSVAAQILTIGMVEGLFTGKALGHYLRDDLTDWVNARRIINKLDRADVIAGHARKFFAILEKLPKAEPAPPPPALPPLEAAPAQPAPVPTPSARPPSIPPPRPNKPLLQTRTIGGAIIALLAGLYSGLNSILAQLGAFNTQLETKLGFSPLWIVLAVFVLAIIIIIYARIDDRIKKGR